MTTEHDLAHGRAAPRAPSPPDDDLLPGRGSRSSQLAAPSHPIAGGLLLRKARDASGVADDAEQAVAAAGSSSGHPLPGPIMRKFESSLGTDLSGVRVHTGAESQTAAESVGAKAYTVGQDIHFGAGHFDPTSSAGEHLIAHEVAHTVQQRGGSPIRQNKLEVSSPGDHLEHEADRAADAMVTGAPIAVTGGGALHRQILRDKAKDPKADQDDKQWAANNRAKIEQLQNGVTTAMDMLNGDASAAAISLQDAIKTCEDFEKDFHTAKQTFTSNVKKAVEHQKEFEEMLKSTLEAALAVYSLGGTELAETVTKAEHVLTIINGVTALVGSEDHKRLNQEVSVGPSGVDWKGHLDKTLTTLTNYIQQNRGLAALNKACIDTNRWLTQVFEGKGPQNARQSAEGLKSEKFAQGTGAAQGQLAGIGKPLSAPAAAFATALRQDLVTRGLGNPKEIERDIAIKWLASQPTYANGTTKTGFGGRGSAEIHAVREYLTTLQVLGKGSQQPSRHQTDVDVGEWDTDEDDDNIVARARVEAAAMKLIGTTADWLGGKINGAIAVGRVDTGDASWNATGPAEQQDPSMGAKISGLRESAGGAVSIRGYSIAPIGDTIENAPSAMKTTLLQGLVTLSVVSLGAGVVSQVIHGPSIGPAPEGSDSSEE